MNNDRKVEHDPKLKTVSSSEKAGYYRRGGRAGVPFGREIADGTGDVPGIPAEYSSTAAPTYQKIGSTEIVFVL
jgi:hypothetical protein